VTDSARCLSVDGSSPKSRAARTNHALASGTSLHHALTDGFQSPFLGGAVIATLGFAATLTLIRTRDSRAHLQMARAEAPPAHA
jgi:hypothetical protein